MADLNPLYNTGTVSIGAGGTALTGVGTNWLSADIRMGDLIFINGLTTYATAAPTTNTALAVAAWPGGAIGAGTNYYIVRLSDAVRLISANASLLQALVPNLVAEGGLTGAADKISYFSGASTKALADFKALIRAIGNLVGVNGGFIRATGAGTAVMQAIVGPVSQASGVPTGALIESGSNANGRYARFADGTQICTQVVVQNTAIAANVASVGVFRGAVTTWTFPAAFASTADAAVSASTFSAASVASEVQTTAAARWYFQNNVSDANVIDRTVRLTAIGRWF